MMVTPPVALSPWPSRGAPSFIPVSENVRDGFLLLESISGRKSTCQRQKRRRTRPGGGLEGFCEAAGAEFRGEAIRGRLHDFRPALDRLVGHAPDWTGYAECTDHVAGEIIDGHGEAADFRVELAVVEGDRRAADLGDLLQ